MSASTSSDPGPPDYETVPDTRAGAGEKTAWRRSIHVRIRKLESEKTARTAVKRALQWLAGAFLIFILAGAVSTVNTTIESKARLDAQEQRIQKLEELSEDLSAMNASVRELAAQVRELTKTVDRNQRRLDGDR